MAGSVGFEPLKVQAHMMQHLYRELAEMVYRVELSLNFPSRICRIPHRTDDSHAKQSYILVTIRFCFLVNSHGIYVQ